MPDPVIDAGKVRRLIGPLRSRTFRRLWLAQLASELGDWAGRIALAVLVLEKSGSPVLTGAVATAAMAPYLGPGQVLTTVFARLPTRRALITCDVVRAVAYAAMLATSSPTALLLLAFLSGMLTLPFESLRSGMLPKSVPTEEYGNALAVATITAEFSLFAGYLAGGTVIALVGTRATIALDAVTFLVSALLLAGLPRPRRRGPTADAVRPFADLGRTAQFLITDPIIRRFTIYYSLACGSAITGETLAPVFVEKELHSGAGLVGALSASVSAGVILFALVAPHTGSHVALLRKGALMAVAGGTAAAALFTVDLPLPFTALPFIALGAVFASRLPGTQAMGLRIPDHIRATAFGLVSGALALGIVVIPPIAGYLADSIGIRSVMVLFSGAAAAVAAIAVVIPLHATESASDADVEAH
jgi:MFS family permease